MPEEVKGIPPTQLTAVWAKSLIGRRILAKLSPKRNILYETKIVEVSPADKHVKLERLDEGDKGTEWFDINRVEVYELLGDLPKPPATPTPTEGKKP
ncbi:hypothetical protein LCGC14_0609170 [marine sediment metagenome]|uniref:Uncharacterized protein n=1 Tax=marine sediment metagenome TaxID=412755 RepID=A0A0F9RD68_9ZZZZ